MILVQGAGGKTATFFITGTLSTVIVYRADGTQALAAGASSSPSTGVCTIVTNAADTTVIGPITYMALDVGGNAIGGWTGVVLEDYPSTGDPLASIVPGAYAVNTAGARIGGALSDASIILDQPTLDMISTNLLALPNGVTTGFDVQRALNVILACVSAKLGIALPTVTIRDANDTVDLVVATTDAQGQRLAVSYP